LGSVIAINILTQENRWLHYTWNYNWICHLHSSVCSCLKI